MDAPPVPAVVPSKADRLVAHLLRVAPTVLSSGMTAGLGLVGGVVLARSLGPTFRGEMAGLVAWIGMLAAVGDIGVGYAASYFVAKSPERTNSIWSQAIVTAAMVGTALALFTAVILPSHLHLAGITFGPMLVGLFSVPWMLAANHQSYLLLGAGHLGDMNRIRLTAAAAYALGVVVLALARVRTPSGFVLVFALAHFLSATVSTLYCRIRLAVRFVPSRNGLRQLFSYGAKTQLGSLSAQANVRLDQLIMSLFASPSELGLYVVAVALSSLAGPLYSALSLVVIPSVLSAPTRRDGATRAVRHIAFAVAVSVPVLCGLAVLALWLLRLLFGEQYVAATPIARVLLAASVFQGVNQISAAVLRSMGQPGRTGIAELAGGIVTAAMMALLLQRMGGLGAAISCLVAYATASCVYLVTIITAARAPNASSGVIEAELS